MFGLGGMKLIIIAVAAAVLLGLGGTLIYNYNSNLKKVARLEIQNGILIENVKHKDALILTMKKLEEVSEEVLAEREKNLNILQEQLENITTDLGDGADDQIAESLKEALRRLEGTQVPIPKPEMEVVQ